MENNQITNFLTVILVTMLIILFILIVIYIFLKLKENKKKNDKVNNKISDNNGNLKKEIEYNKQSIFDFMEFDTIEDNMIIRKNGNRYIMVIECQGINYDLMSGIEKNSVEQAFLQVLNTLRFPIQLYIQTRTVNLGNSINVYKQKVSGIRDEYAKRQMEYNSLINSGRYTQKQIEKSRYELVKAQNLYEYGLDIIDNTEKMNLNKNILKKHYYVIISYVPEDISKTDYDKEEIQNMGFSELYTRAQSIINSLGVCGVNGRVLDSRQLIELLYNAYNRDEAEIYELDKALTAGFDELYSTAKDVIDKRMIEIDREIEKEAMIKANEAVEKAIFNQEKQQKLKQKEKEMHDLIDAMAKSILDENEEIIGRNLKEEAEKELNKKSKKGGK